MRPGILAALCAVVPTAARAQAPVKFGFDTKSVSRARGLGVPVAYGSTWAGSWVQKYGWNGIEQDLQQAKAAGVMPVIQWWYWGDDISPASVENGCTDRYQGVPKDRATWSRLANELADLIVRVGGTGSTALVVIENEFNKNGIETWEPFDGYLAAQAAIFHQRGLKVVIGFGNWGQPHWRNFDRAVAAADMLGTMALQSSVRDAATYLSGADQLLNAARYYQANFSKPTLVTDFAFSSYPEPTYAANQLAVVADIFRRMAEFRAAGVQGMIWRMLSDDPAFDTANYHGIAERSWGLLHADGSQKPAFQQFLAGVLAEAPAPFTSDPLIEVRAFHITELRAAIGSLRARHDLPPAVWTDPTITPGVTTIKAVHLTEMRDALTTVYVAAGLPSPVYATTTPRSLMAITAARIAELRAAVTAIW